MLSNSSAGAILTGDAVLNEKTFCGTCLIQSLRSQANWALLSSWPSTAVFKGLKGQITLPPLSHSCCMGGLGWNGD